MEQENCSGTTDNLLIDRMACQDSQLAKKEEDNIVLENVEKE